MSWDRWHYSGERSFSVKGKSTKIALIWALLFGGSYAGSGHLFLRRLGLFWPCLFAEVAFFLFLRNSRLFSPPLYCGRKACSGHPFFSEVRLILTIFSCGSQAYSGHHFLPKSSLFCPPIFLRKSGFFWPPLSLSFTIRGSGGCFTPTAHTLLTN